MDSYTYQSSAYQEAYTGGKLTHQVTWNKPIDRSGATTTIVSSNGMKQTLGTIPISSMKPNTTYGLGSATVNIQQTGNFKVNDASSSITGTYVGGNTFTVNPSVGTGGSVTMGGLANCAIDYAAALAAGTLIMVAATAAADLACTVAPPACAVVSGIIFSVAYDVVNQIFQAAEADCLQHLDF